MKAGTCQSTSVEGGEGSRTDPRNKLNDLTGKEWVQYSKSFWFQRGLGEDHEDTEIERQHPAPFSYQDIKKLIEMFTKRGMMILDPFCGVASSLKAAALTGRNAIGIEISQKWVALGKERLRREVPQEVMKDVSVRIIKGDCLKRLPRIEDDSIDFIVTSPPYWSILGKPPDHKTILARIGRGLDTKYSKSPFDLGNVEEYDEFLEKIEQVGQQCLRVLKSKSYLALVVGDFRHGSTFYPFHMDLTRRFENIGLLLQGITILAQNNKTLFPYGYPYAFVQNIHHQYILVFRKAEKSE